MSRLLRPLRVYTFTALCLVVVTGCATRTIRNPVFHEGPINLELRHTETRGEPLDRDYEHPLEISSARLANLLSRMQIRDKQDGVSSRGPAIEPSLLFGIAKGVSVALAQANSSQEITVVAVHREMNLGIFDRKFLTSFIAYAKDDELVVHFSRVRWAMPKSNRANQQKRLPQPQIGEHPMNFRVVGADGIRRLGDQSVALDLGDAATPESRVGMSGGRAGTIVRRAVLVQSAGASGPAVLVPLASDSPPEAAAAEPGAIPPRTSPETLRALADLEEARLEGRIPQAEYRARRSELLGSP